MKKNNFKNASLTVETALVLPLFLYFMLAFLYFIQLFTVQEQIQSAITKMGLDLAKTAYIFDEFIDEEEAFHFDQTIFGMEYNLNLQDMAEASLNVSLLKLCATNYLDRELINNSCIINGFDGLSFSLSKVLNGNDDIDVIVTYQVKFPILFFGIDDFNMIQRVKIRAWTGYQIPAVYTKGDNTSSDTMVFITPTGKVYHIKRDCSHIKLSIIPVLGVPGNRRNANGAKYYACEACCGDNLNPAGTYYITTDGTRYHTRNNCSKIKRTVKEVPLTQVTDRNLCKRCGQGD